MNGQFPLWNGSSYQTLGSGTSNTAAMTNSLIDQLNGILQKHGATLPPVAERAQLWGALVSERDEQVLEEFRQFLHDTGEIWKILLELGRE
jgi:hypothetical protein